MARLAIRMLSVFIAATFVVSAGWAANETTEIPEVSSAWTLEFEAEVAWQRVTPLGNLIVQTGDGLYGIDPEEGKIVWRHAHLKNLDEESYEPVYNSPLVLLGDDTRDERVLVVDGMDGRILFDSREDQFTVLSSHMMPRNGGLLLFGYERGAPPMVMSMLDIANGKRLWTNDKLIGRGKLTKLLAALVTESTGDTGVRADPYELDDDAFLIASGTGFYKVSTKTGEFVWRAPTSDNADVLFFQVPNREDMVIVGKEEVSSGTATAGMITTYYRAHKLSDGTPIWPKAVKVKANVNDVIFLDDHVIVSPKTTGKSKMKMVELDTGNSVWGKKGKGLEIPGTILDHDFVNGGLLLVSGADSAWTNKGVEYFLNIVNPKTGELRFVKPRKVKGRLLATEVLTKGILYVTTSELNILDLHTGKPMHKSIVSDGSLVTNDQGNLLYAYSQADGGLWVVDKEKATVTRMTQGKVALKDKDVPDRLEVMGDRIVLSSSQNVVAFSNKGEVQFHAHHPAPRNPAIVRVLLGAQALRAAMASAASGVFAGAFASSAGSQEEGTAGHVMAEEFSKGYATMSEDAARYSGKYFKAANARFKASTQSQEHVFMLVQLPKRRVGLARVSKTTGEMVEKIDLGKDKNPSYQVDAISDSVYYRADANTIVGYRF